jgi:hypothetical protein
MRSAIFLTVLIWAILVSPPYKEITEYQSCGEPFPVPTWKLALPSSFIELRRFITVL